VIRQGATVFVAREDDGDLFVDLDEPSWRSGASDVGTGKSSQISYIPASSANACAEPTQPP
jgi:hypothetical protein